MIRSFESRERAREENPGKETINDASDTRKILERWGVDTTGMNKEQMDETFFTKMREKVENGEK